MIRICQKLKLPLKQTDVLVTEIVGKTRKMPEEYASVLVKMQPKILGMKKVPSWIASRNVEVDWNTVDVKKQGKFEGFPDCCVDAFIERLWNDFEFGWEFLQEVKEDENKVDREIRRLIEVMGANYAGYEKRVSGLNPTQKLVMRYIHFVLLSVRNPVLEARIPPVIENDAKRVVDYARMFQKYPFVLHLACEDCLSDENSPSAIMNNSFSKFCKNEYPELYEKIVDDSSVIDPQKQKSVLEEFWLEHLGYYFKL
jgi:hypothetical protein